MQITDAQRPKLTATPLAQAEGPVTGNALETACRAVDGLVETFKQQANRTDLVLRSNRADPGGPDLALLQAIESLAGIELTHVSEHDGLHAFRNPHTAQIGRTLTQRSADKVTPLAESAPDDRQAIITQAANREWNTLLNKRENIKITITPGTMIAPDLPISFVASRANRPEWQGLPTVLFSLPKPPAMGQVAHPDPAHATGSGEFKRAYPHQADTQYEHHAISHFRSFQSNKAFPGGPGEQIEFEAMTAAGKLDFLRQSVAKNDLIKRAAENSTNPHERAKLLQGISEFEKALSAWAQAESATSEHPLDHNEVATRLWPWDISHVLSVRQPASSAGSPAAAQLENRNRTIDAIQSAIVLSINRLALARDLSRSGPGLGVDHPTVIEFIKHQTSFAPDGKPLSPEEAASRADRMRVEAQPQLVLGLIEKLTEKISVLEYRSGDAHFKQSPDLLGLMVDKDFRDCRRLAQSCWAALDKAQDGLARQRLSNTANLVKTIAAGFEAKRGQSPSSPGAGTANPYSDRLSSLRQLESMLPINVLHTAHDDALRRFVDSESAYVARTLIDEDYANQPERSASPEAHFRRGLRLAGIESSVLKNQFEKKGHKIDVLVTPATALKSGLPITVMSNPDNQNLARWARNPTVIYQFARDHKNPETSEMGQPRCFIGHVRSIKSNQAFTDTFNQQRPSLSPAQAVHALAAEIKNKWSFHAKEEHIPLASDYQAYLVTLKQWAAERLDQQSQGGPATPSESKPIIEHNEVLLRAWLWDITHVSVGDAGSQSAEPEGQRARLLQALGAAAHLSSERLNLAQAFCEQGAGRGTDHPLFQACLTYQFSNQDGAPISKEKTQALISRLSENKKTTLLLGLVERLLEPVSLIKYDPLQTEFQSLKDDLLRHWSPSDLSELISQLHPNS